MTSFLKKYFIYLFLQRREGKEKERERNIHVWLPLRTPYWGPDLACNPGMCPDWESNRRPFVSQAGTQSTERHQLGLDYLFFVIPSCSLMSGIGEVTQQKFVKEMANLGFKCLYL